MTNPLGVHFTPTHQGQHHYDFIQAMQPDLMKLVGSGQVGTPDVQIMADCYELAPNATHIYRNQPLSEQHDFLWRDPTGAAIEHVATMARELQVRVQEARQRGLELPPREQWRILGINEPVIELFPRNEDMSNYAEWLAMVEHRSALLDTYMDTFMAESDKHDLRCFVGNFSGGQPANKKPGEYATYDWFPKTRKRIEASNRRHGLAVHEYWDIPGPEEMANWWTWRWKHCDWDCEIAVLESGVDRQIRGKEYEGNRGWIGHMTAAQYVDQHRRYMLPCMEDERFMGATPFTLDGGKNWASFYIEPCMPEMVILANALRGKSKPVSTQDDETQTFLPSVGNGESAPRPQPDPAPQGDNWLRAYPFVLNVEGGLSLDPNDPGNWYNGQLVGTNHGISGAVWGGQYDIRNLTKEQALEIYRKHYWEASGADKLPWPMSLIHFDTAVQHGVGVANHLLNYKPTPEEIYLGQRGLRYFSDPNWNKFGIGWGRRVHGLDDIAEKSK